MRSITTFCLTAITIAEIYLTHRPPYASMLLWAGYGVYKWDMSE